MYIMVNAHYSSSVYCMYIQLCMYINMIKLLKSCDVRVSCDVGALFVQSRINKRIFLWTHNFY